GTVSDPGSLEQLWQRVPHEPGRIIYPVAIVPGNASSPDQVALVLNRDTGVGPSRAELWSIGRDTDPEQWVALKVLSVVNPSSPGGLRSAGEAINGDGHVVGTAEFMPGVFHAFY